jgi:hypothetical protein
MYLLKTLSLPNSLSHPGPVEILIYIVFSLTCINKLLFFQTRKRFWFMHTIHYHLGNYCVGPTQLLNVMMLKWCTCMIFQYSTEKTSNKRKVHLEDVYELQCQVYKKRAHQAIQRNRETWFTDKVVEKVGRCSCYTRLISVV